MLRTSLLLATLLSAKLAVAQPADAPLRQQLSTLVLERFASQEAVLASRESTGRVLKLAGVCAFVAGGLSTIGFAAGSLSNVGRGASNSISTAIGAGPGPAPTDYTPLLGAAIIGASIGVAFTVLGISRVSSAESERERLFQERSAATALAEEAGLRREFWLAIAAPPIPAPEPVAPPPPPGDLSRAPSAPPPPPADPEQPRRPLRPAAR